MLKKDLREKKKPLIKLLEMLVILVKDLEKIRKQLIKQQEMPKN